MARFAFFSWWFHTVAARFLGQLGGLWNADQDQDHQQAPCFRTWPNGLFYWADGSSKRGVLMSFGIVNSSFKKMDVYPAHWSHHKPESCMSMCDVRFLEQIMFESVDHIIYIYIYIYGAVLAGPPPPPPPWGVVVKDSPPLWCGGGLWYCGSV